MHPFTTRVPEDILQSLPFRIGQASPVLAASEQNAPPLTTIPSAGQLSPGRRVMTSPTCNSCRGIALPDGKWAVRTVCSCITARRALDTLLIAAASISLARLKRKTTTTASKSSLLQTAAKTAMLTSKETSVWHWLSAEKASQRMHGNATNRARYSKQSAGTRQPSATLAASMHSAAHTTTKKRACCQNQVRRFTGKLLSLSPFPRRAAPNAALLSLAMRESGVRDEQCVTMHIF
mmetsp:Transcript_13113/g.31279  ORF Transcript_13113/g.31279 Transcript_13113/m.31279 type:complete len:235 (+) Transcript_13113:998-1702(+)